MRKRGQWRGALAVMSAVAGTGFASGRELVLFFSQLGWAAWIGIPFASTVFGLLMGMLAHAAAHTGAGSFPALCRRLLKERAADAACGMHALLLVMSAVVMLCGAGEAAALALPVSHGYLWGVALALLIALVMNLSGLRALPWVGLSVLLAGIALYAGLALDIRPVRVYLRGDTQSALEGSVAAAILLALAYGAMNACLAAGVAVRFGGDDAHPAAFGTRCGAMLCALLLCANAAIARGGKQLLAQALPTVILSARWGILGFWACVAFGYLCATATLTAALSGLIDLMRQDRRQRRTAMAAVTVALLLCAALGLPGTVGAAYPAMGWVCAAAMAAAMFRASRSQV